MYKRRSPVKVVNHEPAASITGGQLNGRDMCRTPYATVAPIITPISKILTDQRAGGPRQVDDPTSGKVVVAVAAQPAVGPPRPVRLDRVDDARHDDGDHDVAVVVGALGDRAGDDGRAGGGEGALRSYKYSIIE